MSYNPIPPRVWSRVQNRCLFEQGLTTETRILAKGNVLQYKKNSSNLTKQQKYSQIAKGYWTSRRKCFASQTQTYTNPNTASFKRINSINIPFPNNIVGAPNNISGPFQYNVPNPFGCPTTLLEDGGTLIGTTYVNPCTNAVIRKTYVQNCNPTSDSDVPGPIEKLCWDPRFATWYPRQRLNMSNSGDKWPEGYKGLISAITPIPPVLYYDSCSKTLYWTYEYCLPVSSVNIYKDGQFYKVVPAPLTSTPLNDLIPGQTYTFTAKSLLYGVESEVSNSVIVAYLNTDTPTLMPITFFCPVTLEWTVTESPCIQFFNLYQDDILTPIQTIPYPTTTAFVTGLMPGPHSFTVTSVSNGLESQHSLPESVTVQPTYELTGSYTSVVIGDSRRITFTGSGTFKVNCPVSSVGIICVGGGGGGGGGNEVDITAEGGGGGSGAVITMSNCTIPIGSYNINVGSGGSAGAAGIYTPFRVGTDGSEGGTTSFGTSLYSTGGKGGKCPVYPSPTAIGGNIGDCSLNTVFTSNQVYTSLPGIYSDASYNGQGGNGEVSSFSLLGSNGNNTYVTLYSGPVNYIQSGYGGGGGGGKNDGLGGSAGINGVGGILGGSSNNNGIIATTSGSGGGGGGFPNVSVGGNGGNGGQGILIITVPNTYIL